MTKKAWKKPELIVLVRGRPEEAVLETCKSGSAGGPGNANNCRSGGGCVDMRES